MMKTIVAIWNFMVIGMLLFVVYLVFGAGWAIAAIILFFGIPAVIAVVGELHPPPEE